MSIRWSLALAVTAGVSLLIASCGGDNGADDTRALFERLAAAYEGGNADAYAAPFASNARLDDFSWRGPHVQGRDAIREEFRRWFNFLPAHRTAETKVLITDEHMIVAEWADEWSEDGKTVRVDGIVVWEVEHGEIVREADYYDSEPIEG